MAPAAARQVMYADYVVETPTLAAVPKLEDFLGGDNTASYNSTTNATQDVDSSSHSQLTHLYDPTHHHNYFADHPHHHHHQDLKAAVAFSTNSGSEVDDCGSVGRTTQLGCGGATEFMTHSTESTQCPVAGNLSLGAVSQTSEKPTAAATTTAIVSGGGAESDGVKKIADTFGQRTSIYRGVTRHRWTGRYEAHLWDNSCRREGQARKGRQGGYDKEEKAARAYDLAALKYWGPTATTNFPISNYAKELEEMKHVTKQEFIASLRRKSSGFSRGASIYRGVTRHHQQGRWQARIGRVAGNKDLYLGTFATEEEAAEAYDIAAIKFRGVNAVTNFEMSRYDVEAILKSNLPIGSAAKRLKLATESSDQKPALSSTASSGSSTIDFAAIQGVLPISSAVPYDTAAAIFHENLLHHFGSTGGAQVVGSTEPFGSAITPVALMPQTPAEFYIWPHQSY
ncbi:hypothetical protein Cgig2_007377 [Carnegiea gigantea]|uniref:AP2/ERF domain-containing protein n=1 Tax=Carnegiea gigantea TaxID=171969 RepID=A0A9Q1KY84_9CARY|nr:hypothetical protein Cgig2_007377 [Carnegiea gigantea]